MEKVIKIFLIVLILFGMISQLSVCNATQIIDASTGVYDPDEIGEEKELTNKAGVIASAVRNVGIVLIVIATMVLGVKAMIGSNEEKADFKGLIPGILFAAILIVAMAFIPNLVANYIGK